MDGGGGGSGVFPHSMAHMGTGSGVTGTSLMDLDFVDELLYGGCWLETTDGSDFFHSNNNPSTSGAPSTALFDSSSFSWPPPPMQPLLESRFSKFFIPTTSDITTTTVTVTHHEGNKEHSDSTASGLMNYYSSPIVSDPKAASGALVNHNNQSSTTTTTTTNNSTTTNTPLYEFGDIFYDGSELNKIFWLSPQANHHPGSIATVTERLLTALNHIKESTRNKDILIQIWVPVNREGSGRVLTTINQPFALDSQCSRLINYRNISESYQFAADEETAEVKHGLPGRVYVDKVPEWTPDVRFFSADEYPRVLHAKEYDVRGTLALPVFEQGSQNCLGVIEVVLTTQKVNYRPELEDVCNALRAVHLESSAIPNAPFVKEFSRAAYQSAIPEILEVLRSACRSHNLPLAQTWVPCTQQGKQGCRHSNKNLSHCVSTIDYACVVSNPKIRGFHEACSDHHLLKGQGVAGKAFMGNQPCFYPDITQYSQAEYPLSHHARMFGLCAAVAIRLKSVYAGDEVDFVLEFFLPTGCREPDEQRKMLGSLSMVVQQVSKSLRVVTDEELLLSQQGNDGMERSSRLEMFSEDDSCSRKGQQKTTTIIKPEYTTTTTAVATTTTTSSLCLSHSQKPSSAEDHTNKHINDAVVLEKPVKMLQNHSLMKEQRDAFEGNNSNAAVCDDDPNDVVVDFETMKSGERKRIKSDKIITLDVLRQHFAGSLKDAAKSIGVCPTTLKRICRQHGIKRWPSRKIKKVGHSLQKLQVVIDSVQGASGSFQIGSFYSNFPSSSPNLSSRPQIGDGQFSPMTSSHVNGPSPPPPTTTAHELSPCSSTSKSPSSSCSQTSSSSPSCSSGTQNQRCNTTEEPRNSSGGNFALKRVRSEAEVNDLSEETNANLIMRSQSYKTIVGGHHSNAEMKTNAEMKRLSPSTKQGRHHYKQQQQQQKPVVVGVVHGGGGGGGGGGGDAWRVKVAYGDEKIRFRLIHGWGFKELAQEVVKRFNIGDLNGFNLKYLDDDSEWVLLTCDADLEECTDICRSAGRETIRLSLGISLHNQSRSSVGSNSQMTIPNHSTLS